MGFTDYFLIVADFVGYAKSRGIPVGPGRGSGVGSLVAYLLGITDVDPVKYGLLFERCLNPERVSMPDFDIDFCDRRRGEVIDYVADKYGSDHVAQIITFGTLACRAAVRDVGRALGMTYAQVDEIAKLIPRRLGITVAAALEESAELRSRVENDRPSGGSSNLPPRSRDGRATPPPMPPAWSSRTNQSSNMCLFPPTGAIRSRSTPPRRLPSWDF